MIPRLSIVVPTIGRPSLYATIMSILDAGYSSSDEVLVIGDGQQPEARLIFDTLKPRFESISYRELPSRANDFGHTPRNLGYQLASGTCILSIDDDDTYAPGALEKVRAAAAQDPDRILIFKMKSFNRRVLYDVLWKEPVIALGNIGTPMFVVPNVKEKLGSWGMHYIGDYSFISSTVERYGGPESIVWKDDVIAEIRR